MNRRIFYIAMGAVAGVLVVRKLTQTAQRFTPAGVQDSVAGALGGLSEAVREFTDAVRESMAEREAELRATLGLDGSHDVVDAPGHTGGLEPNLPEDGVR
jgi:hypothetical protein